MPILVICIRIYEKLAWHWHVSSSSIINAQLFKSMKFLYQLFSHWMFRKAANSRINSVLRIYKFHSLKPKLQQRIKIQLGIVWEYFMNKVRKKHDKQQILRIISNAHTNEQLCGASWNNAITLVLAMQLTLHLHRFLFRWCLTCCLEQQPGLLAGTTIRAWG